MAEIQSSPSNSPGKIRSKKMSTRIDFTPMVDLGFLLITFFMLTTTLAKPQVMALVMPDKEPPKHPVTVAQSKVLTLLLGANDKVYWYEGIDEVKLDSTDYSAEGLRQVILDKMSRVEAKHGLENYQDLKTQALKKGSHLNVLIKPTNESRFQNLVDALDEMAVCRVRYYMILDISEQEKDFINNPAKGLNFNTAQQLQNLSR